MPVIIRQALSTAASGTQNFTSSGAGTIAAAEFWCVAATADDTSLDGCQLSYGFTDGTNEAACGYSSAHSVARSNCGRGQRADRVISFSNYSGTSEDMGFSFSSFITDGVTLTIDVQAAAAYFVVVRLWTAAEVSNAFVGSATLNASTTPLDITAPAFEPDFVKLTGTALGTALPHYNKHILWFQGLGLNDGSDTQMCVFIGETDNSGSAAASGRIQNDAIGGQMLTSGTVDYTTTIGSYDANGFSLTNAGTTIENDIVQYLAIKLAGTPSLSLIAVDWPTSGNINEETPAFQPDVVEILSLQFAPAYNTSYSSSVSTHAVTNFDASSIFTQQVMIEDAAATMNTSSRSNSKMILRVRDDASSAIDTSAYSLDSLGWNFTVTTHPGTVNKAIALSIKTDPVVGGPTGIAGPLVDSAMTDTLVNGGLVS